MEFAQLAILAAAAGAGDREAQADILFMLIDKDHNQTIEYHELARFCHNAERWGLLLDGDAQRTCEEVWSEASGYGNGMITQAQFRKVASRFRPVDLPAPVAGAEWRELVEKHRIRVPFVSTVDNIARWKEVLRDAGQDHERSSRE